MADRTLTVTLTGDASGLNKALNQSQSALGKFGSAFGGVMSVASGFVVGSALLELPGLFNSAVQASSNLAESQSKVNVVFGEASKEITDWANNSAKAFGQSKQQALEAAGTYGNLFQAFGIGRKEAADMSTNLVELAADLASFNNTSVDDALLALRSGLSGEAEPLKRFGVAINDVRLKDEALRLGLIKTKNEALTPGAKAQASYALIMKDTTLAQGDFARTSDGLANKQRIQAAQWENLKTQLGDKLLPIQLAVTSAIMDKLFPALESMGGAISTVVGHVERFIDRFRSGGESADQVSGVMQRLNGVFEVVRQKLGELASTAQQEFEKFKAYYEASIKPALENLGEVVEWVVRQFQERWPEIERIVRPVMDQVQNIIETVVGVVKGVLNVLIKLIGGDFSGAWTALKDTVAIAWNGIVETVENAVQMLKGLLGLFVDIGKDMIEGMIKGIWAKAGDLINAIKQAVTDKLPEFVRKALGISSPSKVFHEFGENIMEGLADGIRDGTSPVAQAMRDAIQQMRQSSVQSLQGFFGMNGGAVGSNLSAAGGWTHTDASGKSFWIDLDNDSSNNPAGPSMGLQDFNDQGGFNNPTGIFNYGTVNVVAPNIHAGSQILPSTGDALP
jgi:ABC-type transporter Mla subunit MlaD